MKRLWLGLLTLVLAGNMGCSGTPGVDGEEVDVDGPLSPTPKPPSLKSVRAQATGRSGNHLRIEAQGIDANGDVSNLFVRLMRFDGTPSPYFDLDWNGIAESAESIMPLDVPVEEKKQFTAVVTFLDLMAPPPQVFKVAVALVDREGNVSGEQEVDVTFQAVRSVGQKCDASYIEDRCEDGLGCRGDPTVCQPGVAPTIDRGGYFRNPFGPRILIEGRDPDDDVSQVTLSFFDKNNQTVKLDLDNDGILESDTFVVDARNTSVDGKFFVALQTTTNFEEMVGRVTVEPQDAFFRKGSPVNYGLSSPPGRGQGQQCDARGFDACVTGHTCSPGIVGSKNICISSAFARTKKCEAAPMLKATPGLQSARLQLQGASLWEPPSGCAANNPQSRPENVVRLSLPQAAQTLTLSTGRPGTTIDTIVTLLPGCTDAAITRPMACNDDAFKSTTSLLTLNNVPAGEYLVVVDTWSTTGGLVELAIDVK